jgi:spore coat polysaccharide biosynthesis predicted glycosyltransferase SpsG
MTKKIYFLGQGDSNIGMGHISRLVSISMQLEGIGKHEMCVIKPDNFTYKFLEKFKNIEIHKINHSSQILELPIKKQILILDGYDFSTTFLRKLKSKDVFLIYVDDMNDRLLPVDIVINHTNGYSEDDYTCLSNTKFFLGDDYSIIRSNFLFNNFKKKINKINNIFISLGVSNSNLLEDLILKVKECWSESNIFVLTGNNLISNNIYEKKNITLVKQISGSELCNVLDDTDLSIVPVSTLYLESLARNTIVAGGYFVKNQKLVYEKLIGTNTIYELGDFEKLDIAKLNLVKKKINKILPTQVNNIIGSGWPMFKKTIKTYFNEQD